MSIAPSTSPKTVLQRIAQANLPVVDAAQPSNTGEGLNDFLNEVYQDQGVAPLLVSTNEGEIVTICQMLVHNFAKRAPVPFVTCIAPFSKAGVYQMTLVNNDIDQEVLFDAENLPEDFILPPEFPKDQIKLQSAVRLPHNLTHLLAEEAHENAINAVTLANQLAQLPAEEQPENLQLMLNFLVQTQLGKKAPEAIALMDPTSRGSLTQQTLKSSLLHFTEASQVPENPESPADSPSPAVEAENLSVDESFIEEVEQPELTLSKEDKRLLLFLEARERSRESTGLEKLSLILAEDRKESKKEGFAKHFPDHARDTLINARTGPEYLVPEKLSSLVSNLLSKCNSEQMALKQIQADIRRTQKCSVFDCHLDKTTVNSIFRKGELTTDVPVISFQRAVGINFPIFGTSGVMTQIIKSEGDLPFTISESKSITELIEAAKNLRLFMEWVAGTGIRSFAMIGLDSLISFLETNKGKIKRIAEQVPGVYAELQIQCSNVWSSWFNELSFEVPTEPPNFDEVLKPIKNNAAPPKTLATQLQWIKGKSDALADTLSREPPSKRPKPNPGAQGRGNPPANKHTNQQPQLQMLGGDAQAKGAIFGAKLGGGKHKDFNLPKYNGKPICLKFHLLHFCKCRSMENFHHGNLPASVVDQLVAKLNAEAPMISKMQ